MPIHEKKKCRNPIIISSNMGIGNLVKEMLPSAPYINPPFAFPTPKEKHKFISAYVRTEFFIFFPRPQGCTHASTSSHGRNQRPRGQDFFSSHVHSGGPGVRADGVLPCADVVKTPLRVKLRTRGKSGRTRSFGR
jgi:hypothetical protein